MMQVIIRLDQDELNLYSVLYAIPARTKRVLAQLPQSVVNFATLGHSKQGQELLPVRNVLCAVQAHIKQVLEYSLLFNALFVILDGTKPGQV